MCTSALGKTLSQVPVVTNGLTIGKVTRSYTRNEPTIQREVFGRLGGAVSYRFIERDGSEKRVLVAIDPSWNRVVFSADGEPLQAFGGYGAGDFQFRHPSSMDLSSSAQLYVADTDNSRVSIFIYTRVYVGGEFRWSLFDYGTSIANANDFTRPVQVLWDDNGTPDNTYDEIVWVLDQESARVAAYHLIFTPPSITVAPYVRLNLASVATTPTAITKGRSFSSPDPTGTYCNEKLYVYDYTHDQFVVYSIPRNAGFVDPVFGGITHQVYPNPIPGAYYVGLTTDAWGNILGIDGVSSRIYKFDANLQLLDSYGQPGVGPIGTEQTLEPHSLLLERTGSSLGRQYGPVGILTESWTDNSGMQSLRLGVSVRNTSVALTASGATLSYLTTDHSRVAVQILNSAGAVVRTVADSVQASGQHVIPWDGNDNSGLPVRRCTSYRAKVISTSLYAATETASDSQNFYFKPRSLITLRVNSNTPGTRLTFDGRDSTLVGNTYAAACSVCTAHTVEVPPVQLLSGTRYCFESWTGGGNRLNTVNVQRDTTLALTLTTGSPPDTFPDMATLPVELYECNSPYVFLRDASTSAFGLTLFPNTTLRFKVLANNLVPPRFQIRGPFTATGVTFQTTDSISNTNPGKWSGLLVDSVTTVALKNCNITNASVGISTSGLRKLRTLTVDSCYFQFNSKDIQAKFLPTTGTVLRLSGNRFLDSSPIDIWGSAGGAEPTVGCTISSNTFGGLPVSVMVALTGGMQGQINSNWFRGGERNTNTLSLAPYYGSSGPYPDVSLRDNKFNFNSTSARSAVSAPVAPSGSSIYAYYNDWGLYDATSIGEIIYDHTDDALRASVWYQPFTVPSGGGGGGGCPFVLTPTDTGFVTENSILGASELDPSHVRFVDDAYPLSNAVKMPNGHVRIRVAEPESETDVLDYLGLSAQVPEQSDDLGSSLDGRPFAYHIIQRELTPVRWNGRSEPFISPIAPGRAYRGEAGDSLELQVDATSAVQGTPPTGRRGIGISLIPKPQQLPRPAGSPVGITLRVSPDPNGGRWLTVGALVPREHWSTAIIPSDLFADQEIRRLRLIWHSTHTLGWVGLVDTRSLPDLATLPLTGARNSSGVEVAGELRAKDGKSITLRSGDFVDLDFDASSVDAPGARFILLARGRYWPATASPSSGVPTAYGISQNRPNPFNPETAIDLSLPQGSHVSLRVFDVSGKLVRTLVDAPLPAGFHIIRWDGRDERGKALASGVYFYDLKAERFSARKRMVLLR